jgi:nicotinamide mononucleotide transporter
MFSKFNLFEIIWVLMFTFILLTVSVIQESNLIGIVTTLTGMLCVVLVARGSMYNYLFGIINVTLYGFIAYTNGYGGDFVLNIFYYLPMQFVGIYLWRQHKNKDDEITVTSFTMKMWLTSIVVLLIGTLIIGQLMPFINSLFNMVSNPLPFVDAFTTFGSIYAMFLMVKRYQEQWILWIVINTLSIFMWLKIGDMVMVVMWSAYLVNSLYGLFIWNNKKKVQN